MCSPGGQAIRYGIGVGRDGFTWSGVQSVTKKAEWPDWTPPPEMIARQPYLPRHMAGGPGNPLGARAMYLGGTVYRIHGTNAPETIGTHVSSGCIRLTNEDVSDLYSRVNVGTKVIVLPMDRRAENPDSKRADNRAQERHARKWRGFPRHFLLSASGNKLAFTGCPLAGIRAGAARHLVLLTGLRLAPHQPACKLAP